MATYRLVGGSIDSANTSGIFVIPSNSTSSTTTYTIYATGDSYCVTSKTYTVPKCTCELYFCQSNGTKINSVSNATVTSIGLSDTSKKYINFDDLENGLYYDYVYSTSYPSVTFDTDGIGAIIDTMGGNIYKIKYWVNIVPGRGNDYISTPTSINEQSINVTIRACTNTIQRTITKKDGIAVTLSSYNVKFNSGEELPRYTVFSDTYFVLTMHSNDTSIEFYSPYEVRLGTFDGSSGDILYINDEPFNMDAIRPYGWGPHPYYNLTDDSATYMVNKYPDKSGSGISINDIGVDSNYHIFAISSDKYVTYINHYIWVNVNGYEFSIKRKLT